MRKNIIRVGDVVSLYYNYRTRVFGVRGICISKKNRSGAINGIIVRNVLGTIPIEVYVSFMFNIIKNLQVFAYERKRLFYRKAKLYYLRYAINRMSKTKSWKSNL